jgi:hypothetical protein
MKNIIALLLIILASTSLIAQQSNSDCKVLLKELQGEYNGDCKKGLADGKGIAQGEHRYEGEFKKGQPHGEGKYIISETDYYVGSFKKGKRTGFGKHFTIKDGKNIIVEGDWKNGQFVDKEDKFVTVNKSEIKRVSYIFKGDAISGSGENKIHIYLRRGQIDARAMVNGLFMSGSSGYKIDGTNYGFGNAEFPFTGKIKFNVSSAHYVPVSCSLEFKLLKEGNWDVFIYF